MIFRAGRKFSGSAIASLLFGLSTSLAQTQPKLELVDIKKVAPTIVVELRYATPNNITGRALYPPKTKAMVRPEVARRLAIAENYLRVRSHGLKIWDAYRPKDVQIQLWQAARMNTYVADPDTSNGSLHNWGLAVDATLVDALNNPVQMPTDFDDFTPAAMWKYHGNNLNIHYNLRLLQAAMHAGGFYGLRSEWWHFITPEWKRFVPDPDYNFDAPKAAPKTDS